MNYLWDTVKPIGTTTYGVTKELYYIIGQLSTFNWSKLSFDEIPAIKTALKSQWLIANQIRPRIWKSVTRDPATRLFAKELLGVCLDVVVRYPNPRPSDTYPYKYDVDAIRGLLIDLMEALIAQHQQRLAEALSTGCEACVRTQLESTIHTLELVLELLTSIQPSERIILENMIVLAFDIHRDLLKVPVSGGRRRRTRGGRRGRGCGGKGRGRGGRGTRRKP